MVDANDLEHIVVLAVIDPVGRDWPGPNPPPVAQNYLASDELFRGQQSDDLNNPGQ